MARSQLWVGLTQNGKFTVTAEGSDANLAVAADRRDWLKKCWEAKKRLGIDEVLDGKTLKPLTKARCLIAVHGNEVDQHDGQLQWSSCV